MEGKDGECRITEKIEGSIREIGSNWGQMSQGERPAAAGVAEKPGKVSLETAGLAARRSLAAQQEALITTYLSHPYYCDFSFRVPFAW